MDIRRTWNWLDGNNGDWNACIHHDCTYITNLRWCTWGLACSCIQYYKRYLDHSCPMNGKGWSFVDELGSCFFTCNDRKLNKRNSVFDVLRKKIWFIFILIMSKKEITEDAIISLVLPSSMSVAFAVTPSTRPPAAIKFPSISKVALAWNIFATGETCSACQ